MAVKLFGDPYSLQGGSGNLQGGNANLQGGYNPQQVYGPVAPVQRPAPQPAPQRTVAPRPAATPVFTAPAPQPVAPVVQPVQISSMYSPYVQTRASKVNPGVLEYFNPSNGMGFSNPNDVFNYIRTMTGQSITDLKQLEGGGFNAAAPVGTGAMQGNAIIEKAALDPYQNLAEQAGLAGIGYDDYLKIVQGQTGMSFAEKEAIKQQLGITDLETQIFKPALSTEKLYANAYKSAGLADLKKKIDDKLAEIGTVRNEFIDKVGGVNENPWLSEATRSGKAKTLNDMMEARIGNMNYEVDSLKDLYNAGVNEVNNLVTRQTTDFTANQQLNSYKLQYLQGKAEEQIGAKQSEKLSEAYSYLPAYLQAKAKAQKPDVIGTESTGYYRWNQQTGTFEQIVAPADKSLDNAYKLAQIQKLQQEIANGGMDDLDRQYKQAQLQKLQQEIANPNAGKPPTEGQSQAATYAARINQANPIIDNLSKSIANYNIVGFEAQRKLPNNLKSGEIQSFEQAARNFINAVLRRESGAAIASSEFDNAFQQYLPYPGDKPETLAQKKVNRDIVLQGLINSSGQAYGSSGSSGGGNPADPLGIRGFNSAGNASGSTPYLKTLGAVTGPNGSPVWSYGLDVDLKVGDPVKSPVSGTVIAAKPNGGFGNQVKIKTSDGKEIWLSHLDSGTVKVGQVVNPGQIIGYGGKTGTVIASGGGDGSHLDITIKDSNGRLYTAPQVKSYLDKIYV
ncbi:MAG TPA: peptidoglycan DD-metalloendopeptidase family protein [Pyrinomonadaceae bacterium]|jgi:murein DD-endopeptidase MepM/ murein hydrolase activator NlpD